jgi:hypothetical protein
MMTLIFETIISIALFYLILFLWEKWHPIRSYRDAIREEQSKHYNDKRYN